MFVPRPGEEFAGVSYNIRGCKTGSTDGDAGSWAFTPDSLNELVSQHAANGNVTSFGYDLLGRMRPSCRGRATYYV